MRAALSTVSLHHHPLDEALAQAAAAGFHALELLMIPGWVHAEPRSLPTTELQRRLQAHGLELKGIHGGGIDGTTDESLAGSVAYLRTLIPYAAAAGAAFVNINGGWVSPEMGAAERAAALDRIAAGLRQLAPDVRAAGIRVVLENHCGFQIERLADYQRLFALVPDAPWLGVTVDTGHFHAAHEDMPTLIQALAPRVWHVHLKDHIGTRSVAFGTGEIDNAGIVRCLAGIGYQGLLSAELELPDAPQEVAACRAALPYVERLIRAASSAPTTAKATR